MLIAMLCLTHFFSFVMFTASSELWTNPTWDHVMIALVLCVGAYEIMSGCKEEEKVEPVKATGATPRRSRRIAGEGVEYKILK